MTSTTSQGEGKNRSLALIGTILFHAAILLFLLWYVIITPIPPYPPPKNTPEVEVALDFGNNTNGTGNVEAPNKGNNPVTDNNPTPSQSTPTPPQTSATVTSNAEEAPAVVSAKTPGTTEKVEPPAPPTPPQPQISTELASVENKFKHAKGQPGGNGNSGTTGNAGSPDGKTPGVGNGNGGPFEFFLKDRRPLNHPFISDNSQDQGKVVVEIIVDQDGNVIKATPGAKGTTINTPYLYAKAKQAALDTKFSKSPDGTPEQQGTITVQFGVQ